jgi:tripartite-type tricarboxylate transporter receptor subunit TctC
MSAERAPGFPDVPTIKQATGLDWTIGAWRGIAGPSGMPQEVSDKLVPLLRQISESQEFRDFMAFA